jgi:hypothetical protein
MKRLITILTFISLSAFSGQITQTTAQLQTILDNDPSSVITVKQASDFGTIDSTKVYVIDGIIDMGTTSIEIPSGGISIQGFTFDVSQLTSTSNSYTMFTSPGGGSGNVLMSNVALDASGTSSKVFDIVSDTGFNAVEFNTVNFNNCTSLGIIDNYRQGLESGTGRFGGTPELTLKGVWVGGWFIETSIVRSLDDWSGNLYTAGAGFAMSSRFRSNQNIDLPASASFFDFSDSNFSNPSTLQVTGAILTRDGVFDAADTNITPNISASNLSCDWSGNNGIGNTFVGGATHVTNEVATAVSVQGTFYDLAGGFGTSGLQHFDSPAAGQLRHLGKTPIEYRVTGQMVIECVQSSEVDIKIVIWRNATTSFVDGKTTRRVIDRQSGGRDIAYFILLDDVLLNQNDYVKLQVANATGTGNPTAELDSFFTVETR